MDKEVDVLIFIFTLTTLVAHRQSKVAGSDMDKQLKNPQTDMKNKALYTTGVPETYRRRFRRSLATPANRRSQQPRSSRRTGSQQQAHLAKHPEIGISQLQVNHLPKHPDGVGPRAAGAAAAANADSEALATLQLSSQALRVLFQV